MFKPKLIAFPFPKKEWGENQQSPDSDTLFGKVKTKTPCVFVCHKSSVCSMLEEPHENGGMGGRENY